MNKSRMASDYTSKHISDYYLETHDNPLSKSDFVRVIKLFNQKLKRKIYEGLVAHLPGNMGSIGIQTRESKVEFTEDGELDLKNSNVPTDWGATNKLWSEKPELAHKTYVLHENLHTDGKRYKISWNRKFSNIPCIINYRFSPARLFKRGLAKFIKENPNTEYYDF